MAIDLAKVDGREVQKMVKKVNDLNVLVDKEDNPLKIKFIGVKKDVLIKDFIDAVEWIDDSALELPDEIADFYNRLRGLEGLEIPDEIPAEGVQEQAMRDEINPLEESPPVPVQKPETTPKKGEDKKKERLATAEKKAKEKPVKPLNARKDSVSVALALSISKALDSNEKRKDAMDTVKREFPNVSDGYLQSMMGKVSGVKFAIEKKRDNAYRRAYLALKEDEVPTGVSKAIIGTVKQFMRLFEELDEA